VKLPLDLAVPRESTSILGNSQTRIKYERWVPESSLPGEGEGVLDVPNAGTFALD
jgi:hypothetical protein